MKKETKVLFIPTKDNKQHNLVIGKGILIDPKLSTELVKQQLGKIKVKRISKSKK